VGNGIVVDVSKHSCYENSGLTKKKRWDSVQPGVVRGTSLNLFLKLMDFF